MKESNSNYQADISRSNGNIEVSIGKKQGGKKDPVYDKFMGMCAMNDMYAVNTEGMDDSATMMACGDLFNQQMKAAASQVEANLFNQQPMFAGLTEQQANLFNQQPMFAELEKAIVEKAKEEGKITEEQANLFNQNPTFAMFDQSPMFADLFNQNNNMYAGLTEKQKKNLPKALLKAIVEKMKKDGKISESQADLFNQNIANLFNQQPADASLFNQNPMTAAEEAKLLSEDDTKDKEVGPEGEMKVVENPKAPKEVEKHDG
jgi:hypothetical protein